MARMRFTAQGLKDAGEGSRQHYDFLSTSTVGCKWREMGKVSRTIASPSSKCLAWEGWWLRRGILWRWRGPSGLRWVWLEARVRNGHETTDWFQIGKGVCQGCILSPCLFNLYAEYIMRNAGLDEAHTGTAGQSWVHISLPVPLGGTHICHLRPLDN